MSRPLDIVKQDLVKKDKTLMSKFCLTSHKSCISPGTYFLEYEIFSGQSHSRFISDYVFEFSCNKKSRVFANWQLGNLSQDDHHANISKGI